MDVTQTKITLPCKPLTPEEAKKRFETMEAARKKFDKKKVRDLLRHIEKSRREW